MDFSNPTRSSWKHQEIKHRGPLPPPHVWRLTAGTFVNKWAFSLREQAGKMYILNLIV